MAQDTRYHHPADEGEVAALVKKAAAEGKALRVRGAAHSVPLAISPGRGQGSTDQVYELLLDRMIGVRFDDAQQRVSVQAGCHLGLDPKDPAGTSTLKNSLFDQLDQRAWALSHTGGIIHQSAGGFLSTGSSGGSLQHSIYDDVVALRLVDGTGAVHELRRDRDADFFGAVISMGLLGVVVDVTFQCRPRYHVRGQEVTTAIDKSEVDLLGAGTLERFLRETEHTRLMWWPQKGVEKLQVWKAHNMKPADYDAETGPPEAFRPRPYELVDEMLGSRWLPQWVVNKVFRFFGRLNPPPPANALQRGLDKVVAPLFAPVTNSFLKVNDQKPNRFWDLWWHALPMDNEASDDLLPTVFTEAWIPVERTHEVVRALDEHYRRGGWNATGTYACEIYAAKKNELWLSPSYQKDMVRIDLFWFAKQEGQPERDYFPQFWTLLDRFEPRYHWGKYLPEAPAALRQRYPRWDDFLKLRARLDPKGVFLTPYWRARLGI
jgi:FAD/FMN-containing dehydrogenase